MFGFSPMLIRSRAPLRLGLAGGGSDVSPYCDLHGGNVLNATVDRYAYSVLSYSADNNIHITASDRQIALQLPLTSHLELDGTLDLHKAVYNYFISEFNQGRPLPISITTFCDAPVGSGLGASSTVVVSIIRAFCELLKVPLDDYAIAGLAYKIERQDCRLQGGRQDQYSATFGGFNFMEFYANDRTVVTPLRIKRWVLTELEASLVLFFTGVSRESASIIAEQSSGVSSGNASSISALHGLKKEAIVLKECLLRGDFVGVVDSMRSGWESKKNSARTVSTPHIESIYNAAIDAGAAAGKVSGAGGGGFMLFFVAPENRMNVIRRLGKYDGQVSNCHFSKHGVQAWSL